MFSDSLNLREKSPSLSQVSEVRHRLLLLSLLLFRCRRFPSNVESSVKEFITQSRESKVGVSLALEKIFPHSSVDIRNFRCENHICMLVCSKDEGGLLQERMEIVAELWQANLKAKLVPLLDPSLTKQYKYASEHDLKCHIVIIEVGLSQTGLVKVH
ncbi:eIF-2-alpha kinase GCN2-like isoform X2 [Dioscorea cayenensis subsp. rotundata]|uniref:EIF-2-alpha kinase GCN2-like isoform X2 n=1 Tax=Dioscorea cayennensis subsp. rotundata TaxID=55577 RepID=A0AB40BT53_DIOCR|nr:eIF-2-alpha kinase GCN2-like isoform X2 [Dioscorea cayenensis subsp. rotundata]